jgi:enoyl-CoA hydratase
MGDEGTESVRHEDWAPPDGEAVRVIQIDRPEKRNSLSPENVIKLTRLIASACKLRLLLISSPPAFCAGLDLDALKTALIVPHGYEKYLGLLIGLYNQILRHRNHTVVVVDGPSVGGGVGLAMCFDYIIATSCSSFRLPDGALRPFASIVFPIAKRRNLDGWRGDLLSAEEAKRRGAIDIVVPNRPTATQLRDIALGSHQFPSAVLRNGRRPPLDRKAECLILREAFEPVVADALVDFLDRRHQQKSGS